MNTMLSHWIILFLIRAFSLSHHTGSIQIYPRKHSNRLPSDLDWRCQPINPWLRSKNDSSRGASKRRSPPTSDPECSLFSRPRENYTTCSKLHYRKRDYVFYWLTISTIKIINLLRRTTIRARMIVCAARRSGKVLLCFYFDKSWPAWFAI